jgi:hypothetical protein
MKEYDGLLFCAVCPRCKGKNYRLGLWDQHAVARARYGVGCSYCGGAFEAWYDAEECLVKNSTGHILAGTHELPLTLIERDRILGVNFRNNLLMIKEK